MKCAACPTTLNPNHRGPRLERGVVINGVALRQDRDFCQLACLASWLETETP